MLWVRANGSRAIGLGHIMRTIALAEVAIERGVPVTYVVAGEPVASELPRRHGFLTVDANDDARDGWLTEIEPADTVVFDGYQFGGDLLDETRRRGAVVVLIDDLVQKGLPADLVVNQNPTVSSSDAYPAAGRALLGPRYALVRREFRERRRVRGRGGARTIVGTFGGSDPRAVGPLFVSAAGASAFQKVVLIRGPAAASVGAELEGVGVEVVVDPPSVAESFDTADAVVSAAGSSTWELLCMGLPVALLEVADNQRGIAAAVAEQGAALAVEHGDDGRPLLSQAIARLEEPAVRRDLSQAALRMVDGRGAERVLEAIGVAEPEDRVRRIDPR